LNVIITPSEGFSETLSEVLGLSKTLWFDRTRVIENKFEVDSLSAKRLGTSIQRLECGSSLSASPVAEVIDRVVGEDCSAGLSVSVEKNSRSTSSLHMFGTSIEGVTSDSVSGLRIKDWHGCRPSLCFTVAVALKEFESPVIIIIFNGSKG